MGMPRKPCHACHAVTLGREKTVPQLGNFCSPTEEQKPVSFHYGMSSKRNYQITLPRERKCKGKSHSPTPLYQTGGYG